MSESVIVEPARRSAALVWQPKTPVFWVTAALILIFGVTTAVELVMLVSNVSALTAALILLAIQGVLLWLILRAIARFRRQPRSLRLTALVWGATVVPGIAMIANTAYNTPLWSFGLESLSASLTAPINEDALRTLGVFAVLMLGYGRKITVMDGAVYGFLVGMGFEVIENFLYALRGDDLAGTLTTGFTRLLVGFGLHALWTTVAGAGLAYCLSRRQQRLSGRWWVFALAMIVPMVLHAGWDAPPLSIFPWVKLLLLVVLYAVSVFAFFVAVRCGRRSEFAWFSAVTRSSLDLRAFKKLPRAERRRLSAAAVAKETSAGADPVVVEMDLPAR